MKRYNPRNWINLIFALHKSDTLRLLWKEIIYIGVEFHNVIDVS